MMKKDLVSLGVGIVVLTMGLLLALTACETTGPASIVDPPVRVGEPTTAPTPLIGDSLRGGRLYDTWWTVLGWDPPEKDQPLWKQQTSNTRSGADTWRCVECHGWDYRGKDGAYGSGPHSTGFPGIYQDKGKDPFAVLAILKGSTNPDHDFSVVMDDQALTDLALFISQELVDTSEFVESDGVAKDGNVPDGEASFAENCATCHVASAIAPTASQDPWKFLHNVRFGHPAVRRMPPGLDIGFDSQSYADLLAYVQGQTVVVEGGSTVLGARFYDNWWAAMGTVPPTTNQPLWNLQTASSHSIEDTWRCVVCHGWDYRGQEGAASSGSYATSIGGVYGVAGKDAETIMGILTGKTNPEHDFSGLLDQESLSELAAFLQRGMIDTTPYINADKTANGDAAKGQSLYETSCQFCHGPTGTAIDLGEGQSPTYIGTIAGNEPWKFYHRVFFGVPGAAMPAGMDIGLTPQDVADLLKYAQTLSK